MNLTDEDKKLLGELCAESHVSYDKVFKLLQTVQEYEFRERRTGVYDALREILTANFPTEGDRA
jgi:hypothetical protein